MGAAGGLSVRRKASVDPAGAGQRPGGGRWPGPCGRRGWSGRNALGLVARLSAVPVTGRSSLEVTLQQMSMSLLPAMTWACFSAASPFKDVKGGGVGLRQRRSAGDLVEVGWVPRDQVDVGAFTGACADDGRADRATGAVDAGGLVLRRRSFLECDRGWVIYRSLRSARWLVVVAAGVWARNSDGGAP